MAMATDAAYCLAMDDGLDALRAFAPDEPPRLPADAVVEVPCGRCGWPNRRFAQRGMRALSFVCQWCGKRTVAIVDHSLKRHIIP